MSDTFMFTLKERLDSCITELDSIHHLFCQNPEKDFTRDRKISFQDTIRFMIELQSKSLPNEVIDFFGHDPSSPSVSAFIQQREKILVEGWNYLFRIFTSECLSLSSPLYKGYRLLACDGSDINIFRNPDDEESFISEGEYGYNAIHLNALFDLLGCTYYDFTVQGKKKLHERSALNTMVDRYNNSVPAIFIADRGYESFNTFAHIILKKQHFLIRIKDIHSNGIVSAYELPDSEFDTFIQTTLTRRHTQETLSHPETYTILPPYTDFDFLDSENQYFEISFRIVRFMTPDGSYVCVATNLPEDQFTAAELRDLYRMRWGEETSFRQLKYTIGVINFHSKKRSFITQELIARMIVYNFCQVVNGHAAKMCASGSAKKQNEKYRLKVNFATTVNICRSYIRQGGDENELLLLICKHMSYIKRNAKYPIRLRPKRNRDFVYRVA